MARIQQRQTGGQINRRAALLRYLESLGGEAIIPRAELAKVPGLTGWALPQDIPTLVAYGVLEVTRRSEIGKGSLPSKYRVLKSSRWYLSHAGQLEQQRRAAPFVAAAAELEHQRKLKEQERERAKVARENRRASMKRASAASVVAREERKKENPRRSDKLLRELVLEGLRLPAEELAAWGG